MDIIGHVGRNTILATTTKKPGSKDTRKEKMRKNIKFILGHTDTVFVRDGRAI